MDGAKSDKKIKKAARNKRKGMEQPDAETTGIVISTIPGDLNDGGDSAGMNGTKKSKLKRKKSYKENNKEAVRYSNAVGDDSNHYSAGMNGTKKNKLKKKKSNKENNKEAVQYSNTVADDSNQQNDNLNGPNYEKKMKKVAKNAKRKGTELPEAETTEIAVSSTAGVDEANNTAERSDKKKNKLKKKKRNKQNRKEDGARAHAPHSNEVIDVPKQHGGISKSVPQVENNSTSLNNDNEVYQISSGDEDETTGMKRWIMEYHRARPGAEVLLERINDFLVDYWAQKEKERKERESEAAEGGWTVVTHVKGRKKTTDAESGTTMGSVAQAAVIDKMSKKKNKQVGLNFYRFQRRDAQRNEIMTLQSKFEQDKKRIQQMRAARKFRPY